MALKMTGRNEVLSFWNSIHGRTYLSASMSGMPIRKQGYAPAAPGVLYGAYPDCAHCPFEKDCSTCGFFCLKFLDEKMKYESSGEIGAVIVEAYQGAGIIVPPKGWLKALENWAHDHGALFILDEIQSGMGRTGTLYEFLEQDLDPDMLLLGKALANGMHIGAVLAKNIPADPYRVAMAGGSGDSEFNMAAGCAVFEELLENGLLEHIRDVSKYLEKQLNELKDTYKSVKNICCRGLACSIELECEDIYHKLMRGLKENRLIVGRGANNKIVFRPPYVITKDQIDTVIEILKKEL
jgi:4-aminobutyrate aminotransferase-like enzyme